MDYIDQKYINQISVFLRNFKHKSENNYNFSCPFCGDSKKNQSKARGYIYEKRGNLNYYCHNCGKSCSLKNLIKFIDESIYNEYCLEKFNTGLTKRGGVGVNTDIHKIVQSKKIEIDSKYSLSLLDSIHPIKQYIRNRKIPLKYYNILYYTDNFKYFIQELNEKYKLSIDKNIIDNIPNDQRIIIPFYKETSDLFIIQGRFFSGSNTYYRYITINLYKNDSYPKIYGMERWNPKKTTYITEGPLDSLFLDNCLAIGGSTINISSPFFNKFDKLNTIFIFDNEPYNKEIVNKMHSVIELGYKIFIWPQSIHSKDINDYIMNNDNDVSIFYNNENYFNGIRAKLEILKYLKKV